MCTLSVQSGPSEDLLVPCSPIDPGRDGPRLSSVVRPEYDSVSKKHCAQQYSVREDTK